LQVSIPYACASKMEEKVSTSADLLAPRQSFAVPLDPARLKVLVHRPLPPALHCRQSLLSTESPLKSKLNLGMALQAGFASFHPDTDKISSSLALALRSVHTNSVLDSRGS